MHVVSIVINISNFPKFIHNSQMQQKCSSLAPSALQIPLWWLGQEPASQYSIVSFQLFHQVQFHTSIKKDNHGIPGMISGIKFPNLQCDVKQIRKVAVLIEEVLQDCHKVEIGKWLRFQDILWINQENLNYSQYWQNFKVAVPQQNAELNST